MSQTPHPKFVKVDDITAAVQRHDAHLPQDIRELEEARQRDIPARVQQRRKEDPEGAYLTKAELETLVQWKLKHGTYRPTLLALVRSNPAELVKSTSQTAFSSLSKPPYDWQAVPTALNELTKLKGVGPATASLLLSTFAPDELPFFSDEMYNFFATRNTDSEVDWKARIKAYGIKQYREVVWEGWLQLRERLQTAGKNGSVIGARDVEMAVWVWAREDEGGVARRTGAESSDEIRQATKPAVASSAEATSADSKKRRSTGTATTEKPAKRQTRSSDKAKWWLILGLILHIV